MLKPGGVGFYCDGINTHEVHTSTCFHCGKITDIPSMRKMHEYVDICRNCFHFVCLSPECLKRGCSPLIKRIEAQEKAAYQRDQLRKML